MSGDLSEQVEGILRGSFDLHVHAGYDPGYELRYDALDTGRFAHEAEMAGFVLKSHVHPTTEISQAVSRVYPGLNVLGSVVLNAEVGGLNPDAARSAAIEGAKVVWMPTNSADFFLTSKKQGPGIRLVNDSGKLLPEVHDILDIVRHRDLVLASGHVSPNEAIMLFRTAKEKGIERLVATHPFGTARVGELREMASLGAYLEYPFLSCMPGSNRATPSQMVADVKKLGIDRCIVTTDLGQWQYPSPAEGMRMAIASMLDAGMQESEVSTVVRETPLALVG